jgi:transcriptional regulator with XRE-family HTH domain
METIPHLIDALLEKGWTIAAIADELGYSRDSIERWRKGSNPPSSKLVTRGLQDLLRRKRIPKRKRYTRQQPVSQD